MVMPFVSGTCFPKGFRVKCALGTVCSACMEEGRQQEMCDSPSFFSLLVVVFGTVSPEEGKVRTWWKRGSYK